jgi:hypothetical protein
MTKRTLVCSCVVIQALLTLMQVALCQGEVLGGLQSVTVITNVRKGKNIGYLDISESQVQTDVELKLRLAGIKVKPDSAATLSVMVLVDQLKSPPGIKVVAPPLGIVGIRLLEPVRLVRDPTTMLSAITWESSGVGNILQGGTLDDLGQRCRNAVRDLTDSFINDYLSVNPK